MCRCQYFLALSGFGTNGPMSKSEVNFNNGASEHVLIVLGIHKTPFMLIGLNRNEAMGRFQLLKSSL